MDRLCMAAPKKKGREVTAEIQYQIQAQRAVRNSSIANSTDMDYSRKLMEKMGWQNGKGLGSDLQGDYEPVKANGGTTQRGFGYTVSGGEYKDYSTIFAKFEGAFASMQPATPSLPFSPPTSDSEADSSSGSDSSSSDSESCARKPVIRKRFSRDSLLKPKLARSNIASKCARDAESRVLGAKAHLLFKGQAKVEDVPPQDFVGGGLGFGTLGDIEESSAHFKGSSAPSPLAANFATNYMGSFVKGDVLAGSGLDYAGTEKKDDNKKNIVVDNNANNSNANNNNTNIGGDNDASKNANNGNAKKTSKSDASFSNYMSCFVKGDVLPANVGTPTEEEARKSPQLLPEQENSLTNMNPKNSRNHMNTGKNQMSHYNKTLSDYYMKDYSRCFVKSDDPLVETTSEQRKDNQPIPKKAKKGKKSKSNPILCGANEICDEATAKKKCMSVESQIVEETASSEEISSSQGTSKKENRKKRRDSSIVEEEPSLADEKDLLPVLKSKETKKASKRRRMLEGNLPIEETDDVGKSGSENINVDTENVDLSLPRKKKKSKKVREGVDREILWLASDSLTEIKTKKIKSKKKSLVDNSSSVERGDTNAEEKSPLQDENDLLPMVKTKKKKKIVFDVKGSPLLKETDVGQSANEIFLVETDNADISISKKKKKSKKNREQICPTSISSTEIIKKKKSKKNSSFRASNEDLGNKELNDKDEMDSTTAKTKKRSRTSEESSNMELLNPKKRKKQKSIE